MPCFWVTEVGKCSEDVMIIPLSLGDGEGGK